MDRRCGKRSEVRGGGRWEGSVNMAVVNDMYPLIKASGGYQPSVIPTCLIVDRIKGNK